MAQSNSRRRLLLSCGCCALAGLPVHAGAADAGATEPDWRASLLRDERSLWLVRGEDELRATYWRAARGYDRDQYLQICWVMRDVRANRVFPIDRNLLDVLCGIQTWLARNGVDAPIRINSAYRTMATNRRTEGAARNSKHVLGKAADIVVGGVSPVKLAGMASVFGRGGTGFYVGREFVHVDTGDERIWIDQRRRSG